ncbi:MAG: DUF501 domain-containing protein [Firmicutes bacterium]|jgi:hypothetical protein|nr:DUF501 domain-containing protein [Bacillota bacterium]
MLHQKELEKIARQLGRTPQGVVDVAKYCLAGHPQVITSYPIRWRPDGPEIFPTLYWLTCPALRRHVGALETESWIERLQEMLDCGGQLAERWQAAHREYANKRLQLVPGDELAELSLYYPAQAEALRETGIGGIRGRGIKCLHTHLADFLADSKRLNPIGSLAAAILEDKGISVDFCFDYQLEGFCRGHDAANSS